MQFGMIGLGRMGANMVRRLMRAGHTCTVYDRNADAILARIQPELLPDQADKIVSINVTTGEFVLADTLRESSRKFRERWPDEIAFQVRADGGPVMSVPWV